MLIGILLVLLSFTYKAHGMIFISPGLNYMLSTTSDTGATISGVKGTTSIKVTGYSGSLKVGFSTGGVALGALYQRSASKGEVDSCHPSIECSSTGEEVWKSRVGGFLGFQLGSLQCTILLILARHFWQRINFLLIP